MAKGILTITSLLLLCISNEVISMGVLVVWAFIGLARFLKAAAEGGAFD